MLWDFNIQWGHITEATRPDIVVVVKEDRVRKIIDVTVPADSRVNSKESEKIEKYQDVKREVSTMWAMRKVEVIPVVVVALGAICVQDRVTRICKNTTKREKI